METPSWTCDHTLRYVAHRVWEWNIKDDPNIKECDILKHIKGCIEIVDDTGYLHSGCRWKMDAYQALKECDRDYAKWLNATRIPKLKVGHSDPSYGEVIEIDPCKAEYIVLSTTGTKSIPYNELEK